MLLCFGFAWPFSIRKSYVSRSNNGKSLVFLIVVIVGYIAGILHKILYNFDLVIWFYVLDMAMVVIDTGMYVRNYRLGFRKTK